jgi:hypothetical protein
VSEDRIEAVYADPVKGADIDRVCADDREWFEKNPGRSLRLRAPCGAERETQFAAGGDHGRQGILVIRLREGVRIRQPVRLPAPLQLFWASEAGLKKVLQRMVDNGHPLAAMLNRQFDLR